MRCRSALSSSARNFSIIEMNFLRAEDLIVLMPFARDQNQIAPSSRAQRDANRRAPIGFNPITRVRFAGFESLNLLQTGLLYSSPRFRPES